MIWMEREKEMIFANVGIRCEWVFIYLPIFPPRLGIIRPLPIIYMNVCVGKQAGHSYESCGCPIFYLFFLLDVICHLYTKAALYILGAFLN